MSLVTTHQFVAILLVVGQGIKAVATVAAADELVVVRDNRYYRILKEDTAALLGGDVGDYECVGFDFDPPVDLVASAEAHGGAGVRLEALDVIDDTLDASIDREESVVVSVPVTDR